jgi:acyl-CoA thioesterase-1
MVALGASNTQGKGVERGQDFPAQRQATLRAAGLAVSVANAGAIGDTTAGMSSRFDGAVDSSTRAPVLQPGADESAGNIARIRAAAASRRIRVATVPNAMLRGEPRQGDDQHPTPDGYRALAAELFPRVIAALR